MVEVTSEIKKLREEYLARKILTPKSLDDTTHVATAYYKLFLQKRLFSMKNNKKFNCVEMKNKIQTKIYNEIRGMSLEEENEYRRKKIESSATLILFVQ